MGKIEEAMSANPQNRPRVALIVLNWNGQDLLEPCLDSLKASAYPAFQIFVVDNGSQDRSVSLIKERYPDITLIENRANLGFTDGMNVGFQAAYDQGFEILISINNDVTVRPNWLDTLISAMEADPTIGVAGCKLLYPDQKTLQHAGGAITFPRGTHAHFYQGEPDQGQADVAKAVDYVTGAAFAIRRAVIDQIGLLDRGFRPFYFEEVDFCFRTRTAGWKVMYIPAAVAIHHESMSVSKLGGLHLAYYHKNRVHFVVRHLPLERFIREFVPAELTFFEKEATTEELGILESAFADERRYQLMHQDAGPERDQWLLALEWLAQAAGREKRVRLPARLSHPIIEDARFSSTTPIIGGLIVRFKTLWNNIAARWYVRMMVDDLNNRLTERDQMLLEQVRSMSQEITYLKGETRRLSEALIEAKKDSPA